MSLDGVVEAPETWLFGGFYILDVASLDDAVAWAKKMPLADGTEVEIRRVTRIR